MKRTKRGWLKGKRCHPSASGVAGVDVEQVGEAETGTEIPSASAPPSSATTATRLGSDFATVSTRSASDDDTPVPSSRRFANSAFGDSCSNLLRIAGAPMSGAALEKVAPTAAAASHRRSPRRCWVRSRDAVASSTPSDRRWPASVRTCSRSSPRSILAAPVRPPAGRSPRSARRPRASGRGAGSPRSSASSSGRRSRPRSDRRCRPAPDRLPGAGPTNPGTGSRTRGTRKPRRRGAPAARQKSARSASRRIR